MCALIMLLFPFKFFRLPSVHTAAMVKVRICYLQYYESYTASDMNTFMAQNQTICCVFPVGTSALKIYGRSIVLSITSGCPTPVDLT